MTHKETEYEAHDISPPDPVETLTPANEKPANAQPDPNDVIDAWLIRDKS